MRLGLKAKSHHMTFRGNVECTSLTTSSMYDFVSDATQPTSSSKLP